MALVDLKTYIPESKAVYDMRYGTDNNILGKVLQPDYPTQIDEAVADRLVLISNDLAKKSLVLVFWDLWRPRDVHRQLLDFNDDPMSVNPNSPHLYGAAVDGTLAVAGSLELLDMGTEYDDFTKKAWPGYPDLTQTQRQNRDLHTEVFARYGFSQWPTEWFHMTFDKLAEEPQKTIS